MQQRSLPPNRPTNPLASPHPVRSDAFNFAGSFLLFLLVSCPEQMDENMRMMWSVKNPIRPRENERALTQYCGFIPAPLHNLPAPPAYIINNNKLSHTSRSNDSQSKRYGVETNIGAGQGSTLLMWSVVEFKRFYFFRY